MVHDFHVDDVKHDDVVHNEALDLAHRELVVALLTAEQDETLSSVVPGRQGTHTRHLINIIDLSLVVGELLVHATVAHAVLVDAECAYFVIVLTAGEAANVHYLIEGSLDEVGSLAPKHQRP